MSVQLKNTRSAFPFDAHFADVFGSRVHYVRHYIQEDCPREIGESLADWVSIATNQKPRNYKEITR